MKNILKIRNLITFFKQLLRISRIISQTYWEPSTLTHSTTKSNLQPVYSTQTIQCTNQKEANHCS